MAVVSTMILRSLRMIGEKPRGGTLTADEAVECLDELNTFMEALNTERLFCYTITEDTFALTASTSSYTIGPGATIDTDRPTRIVDPCFIRDSSNFDSPINLLTVEQWGKIVQKDVGFTYPTELYYDGDYTATSTARLYLYPSPSADLTLHVHSWKQLANFSTVTHEVLLPPGYRRFIESNFAVDQAAGWANVTPEVAKIASDSRAAIKRMNAPHTVMELDSTMTGVYRGSILTGP